MHKNVYKLAKEYPKSYELYDMENDRTELNDVSLLYPHRVDEMKDTYEQWAKSCGIIPREIILELEKIDNR